MTLWGVWRVTCVTSRGSGDSVPAETIYHVVLNDDDQQEHTVRCAVGGGEVCYPRLPCYMYIDTAKADDEGTTKITAAVSEVSSENTCCSIAPFFD